MNFRYICLLIAAAVVPVFMPAEEMGLFPSFSEGIIIFGSKEMVSLDPPGIILEGRVDTGAALSSLHGREITYFTRDESRWVRFNLDYDGEDLMIEKPVVSVIRVVQAGLPVGMERPVVRLDIRIGSLVMAADFTIADRSRMSFPVLIGRNILSGHALVDVSRDFIQSVEE